MIASREPQSHPPRRAEKPSLALPVSILLHGAAFLALALLGGGAVARPTPSNQPLIELVQQNTVTGGGDRFVQGEGGPGSQAHEVQAPAPETPTTHPMMANLAAPDAARDAVPIPPPAVPSETEVNLNQPDDSPGGEAGTGRVTEGSSVIPAAIDSKVHNPAPAYPPAAERRGEQGRVGLRIHVLPDGRADGVFVIESSGHVSLDDAARAAAAHWRYRPAIQQGRAVASDLLFRFDFVINNRG